MAMNLSKFMLPIRAVQLLFALILLGVDGSLVSLYNSYHTSPSQFNYVIFVSLFTLIVTTYLLVTTWRFANNDKLTHPFLVFGLEAVSWLFWLAAWAAFANVVSSGLCTNWYSAYLGCGRIKAVLAFALLEWFLFCVTAAVAAMAAFSAFRHRRSNDRSVGVVKNASSSADGDVSSAGTGAYGEQQRYRMDNEIRPGAGAGPHSQAV